MILRQSTRILDTLPGNGKFVLNGTDRPFGDHSGAKGKVTPAIRRWTLHDLRRSFASGLQRLGVAPHIVELALNHRSGTFSGVAGIYQRHRYVKEVREAFELWSQHIEALTIKKAIVECHFPPAYVCCGSVLRQRRYAPEANCNRKGCGA
jgi:hypothetical protein